jgi:hypothetical protein
MTGQGNCGGDDELGPAGAKTPRRGLHRCPGGDHVVDQENPTRWRSAEPKDRAHTTLDPSLAELCLRHRTGEEAPVAEPEGASHRTSQYPALVIAPPAPLVCTRRHPRDHVDGFGDRVGRHDRSDMAAEVGEEVSPAVVLGGENDGPAELVVAEQRRRPVDARQLDRLRRGHATPALGADATRRATAHGTRRRHEHGSNTTKAV